MLTHCPICKYDLTGLPDKHLCPECSYEFDRDSELIALDPFRPRWIRWGNAICGLAICSTLLFALLRRPDLFWFLFSGQFLCLLGTYLSLRTNRTMALVHNREVQLIRRRAICAQYSLAGAAKAELSFVEGALRLLDAQGRELNWIPLELRWSITQTIILTAAINARLAAQANIRKPST